MTFRRLYPILNSRLKTQHCNLNVSFDLKTHTHETLDEFAMVDFEKELKTFIENHGFFIKTKKYKANYTNIQPKNVEIK